MKMLEPNLIKYGLIPEFELDDLDESSLIKI